MTSTDDILARLNKGRKRPEQAKAPAKLPRPEIRIPIFLDKRTKGLEPRIRPDELPTTKAAHFPSVLSERPASSDPHATGTVLLDAGTGAPLDRQFRPNRPGFSMLDDLGVRAEYTVQFTDIDREPHAPLDANLSNDEKRKQLERERTEILAAYDSAGLGCPFALWPTRGGWRTMWLLSQPIQIANEADYDRIKGHITGVIYKLWQAGLNGEDGRLLADPNCVEPNRLYRMPFSVRDGVQTWTEDYMTLSRGVEVFA